MYAHFVIPVDGSTEAKRAARRGLELASAFDATVDVLHVVAGDALGLARGADERERLLDRGREALAAVEAIAADVGQPVETALREGTPAARICEFAAERDADLVVVGRQGMTGLGRRLLGGVTEHVLHRGDVPVLVVPGGADDVDAGDGDGDATADTDVGTGGSAGEGSSAGAGYDRILVPTDGSDTADAATRHAVAIGRRYDPVVHLLNVVDLQAAGGLFSAGGLEAEFVGRLEERGRETVDRMEAALRETAPDLAVDTAVVRTTSFDGAAAGIREYVTDEGIDLVVMGSHGRSNLRRQLLGSVASAVLRTVDVPVLVVKRSSGTGTG
jgi:nucleotide-binding universal stress UspA family protein